MKLLFSLLFIISSAYASSYGPVEHSKLQDYVGYHNLSEHPDITWQELDFLSFYMDKNGPWFSDINEYLRRTSYDIWVPERLLTMIDRIDKLQEKTPALPENLILFRGQSMQWMQRHYAIGEEFRDQAYFSTTTQQGVARYYSGYNRYSFVMVLYFADAKDARGIVINNQDKEVLLARGLRFRVMDSAKGNARRYGLVQICNHQGCNKQVTNRKIRRWWNHFKRENLTDDSGNDHPARGIFASEFTEYNSLPDA